MTKTLSLIQLREKLELFVKADRNMCAEVINHQRRGSSLAREEEHQLTEEEKEEDDDLARKEQGSKRPGPEPPSEEEPDQDDQQGGVAALSPPTAKEGPRGAGPVQPAPLQPASAGDSRAPVHLELRLRTSVKEATNICFEFLPGTDTAAGVSRELVAAGLLEELDREAVASHLQRMTEEPPGSQGVTFKLASFNSNPAEAPGDVSRLGFAKLSYLGPRLV